MPLTKPARSSPMPSIGVYEIRPFGVVAIVGALMNNNGEKTCRNRLCSL